MKLRVMLLIFLCFLGAVAVANIGALTWGTLTRTPNEPVDFEQPISFLGDPIGTPGGGGNL